MDRVRFSRSVVLTVLAVLIASALFLFANGGFFKDSPEPQSANNNTAPGTTTPVVWVYDGDTIRVRLDGELEDVRLLGIDTPEVETPYTDVECFGEEASAFTKQQLTGTEVVLARDPQSEDHDAYERLLRYVYLSDGSLLNETLIAEGYARAYQHATYTQKTAFFEKEKEAKEQEKGLWAMCGR